jgi:hypothetical protein
MRSMWRDLARQWLGGEGSEALAGDSSFLDRFPIALEAAAPAFRVSRVDGVSHTAMLRAAAQPAAAVPSDYRD